MKVLIIISIFCSSIALSSINSQIQYCDLKLPKYIIYGNKPIDEINFSETLRGTSNCHDKKIHIISETIKNINGDIPFNYLSQLYYAKGINLVSEHKSIHILSFSEYLKKQLITKTGDNIQGIKHDLGEAAIFTDDLVIEKIDKDLRVGFLKYKSFSTKSTKSSSFKYDYKVQKFLISAKNALYPYSSELKIGVNLFRRKHNIWKSEENLFVDKINHLNAYKLIKILKKGKALKHDDIKLRNVVHTGKVIPVMLENSGLLIKTIGISQNSGKIGDVIEVKLKNNKIVRGVIDIGKEYYVKI